MPLIHFVVILNNVSSWHIYYKILPIQCLKRIKGFFTQLYFCTCSIPLITFPFLCWGRWIVKNNYGSKSNCLFTDRKEIRSRREERQQREKFSKMKHKQMHMQRQLSAYRKAKRASTKTNGSSGSAASSYRSTPPPSYDTTMAPAGVSREESQSLNGFTFGYGTQGQHISIHSSVNHIHHARIHSITYRSSI